MLIVLATQLSGRGRFTANAGFPGAGKTYMAAILAIFLVLTGHWRILWAANSNTPLSAAITIFDELLEDASSYVRSLFAWLPGDAKSMAGAMPLTIPLKQRGLFSPGLECALITAGSFQADISKEYGPLTRFEPVHFLMLDEAQGFGKWSEALLLTKLRPDGCILPIGDPAQPGGAS